MSALGHEQTSRNVRVMSVIPPKADIHQHGLHVRLVPTSVTDAEISRTLTQVGDVTVCRPFIGQARYGRNQTRLGVRYWQRRPLSLHFLFNDKAQYQKRYWPNSYPNSQPLCMSFLEDRS